MKACRRPHEGLQAAAWKLPVVHTLCYMYTAVYPDTSKQERISRLHVRLYANKKIRPSIRNGYDYPIR